MKKPHPLATKIVFASLSAGLCAGLMLSSATALAQYKWRDDNGRIVYSDQPPPVSVKRNNVLSKPGTPIYLPVTADAASGATAAAPSSASSAQAKRPSTPAEQEAAFKKRRDEQGKAEDKAAKEAADAAAKKDQCDRLRSYAAALDSGVRVRRYEANGNSTVLEDSQRKSELEAARSNMAAAGC